MEQQQFKTIINASREIVWDVLWDDASYPLWTSIFSAGSVAKTDWKQGSKVLFLSGEGEGMVSIIAEKKPNEFMSFKHLGTVKDGVEDLDSEETQAWSGSLENYTLKAIDGKTELTVDMDITEEYMDYFREIWPKALEKVKELAEARG
ncbi:MAG: SRPBCC domain-containing protein [Fulvivirga sp.]